MTDIEELRAIHQWFKSLHRLDECVRPEDLPELKENWNWGSGLRITQPLVTIICQEYRPDSFSLII
jgi:hypothetical protein